MFISVKQNTREARFDIIGSSLIRFLTFAAMMSSWLYIPLFAQGLGIPDVEIGYVVTSYALAFFISSLLFGRASDKYGRKPFLFAGLLLSSLTFSLQIFALGFMELLAIRALVGFCEAIHQSSLIAHAYERQKDLSKFLSFGSFGWASGSLISGVLASSFSIKNVFVFSSLLSFIAFVTASRLRFPKHISIDVPALPARILRKNLQIYLPILIRQIGAHVIWTFWPVFLRALGASLFWVGLIQSIGTMTQFIAMYTFGGKMKDVASIIVGLALSSVAFFSFTLVKNHWQIMPVLILLGISWALLYVGGLRYLMKNNIEKATVSGVLDSVLYLSSVIGPFIATLAIAIGGFELTTYLASTFAVVAFLSFGIQRKRHPPETTRISKATSHKTQNT